MNKIIETKGLYGCTEFNADIILDGYMGITNISVIQLPSKFQLNYCELQILSLSNNFDNDELIISVGTSSGADDILKPKKIYSQDNKIGIYYEDYADSFFDNIYGFNLNCDNFIWVKLLINTYFIKGTAKIKFMGYRLI